MKRVLAILAVAMLAFSGMASADQINFGYSINVNPDPGSATFTFQASGVNASHYNTTYGNASIGNTTDPGFQNAPVFLSNNSFTWNGGSGSGAFVPNPINITVGGNVNGSGAFGNIFLAPPAGQANFFPTGVGTMTATLTWFNLTSTNSGAVLTIRLDSITCNSCTNTVLSNFAAAGGKGTGTLTFQINGKTASQLVAGNTGTGDAFTTSGSATLTAVPEPASMTLLGTGLLAGGSFLRRKLAKRQ